MRLKFVLPAAAVATAIVLFAASWSTVRAEVKSPPPPPPRGAVSGLVVAADPLPAGGVGRVKAVRVADPAKLAALEAFFPDYARRPRGNTAAGWIAGHHVYFDLPGGDTVRVAVSANDEGATWSAGQGDFDTRGDFKAFVAALPK